jgi:Replication initiator protein A
MNTPHANNQSNPDAERLSDILSRVGRYVEAEPTTPTSRQTTPQPEAQPDEQPNLPLAVPNAVLPMPPEYIRSEAFLEISGFFTPASKRIENIYIKEKKLKEYIDDQGKKKILKTTIRASHGLGLPITSDLDYYRAFLKLCDEIVDRDRRFHMPVAVPSFRLARYAGKQWNNRVHKEIREWLKRMTLTGIEGAIYRAKKKNYDDGFVGTVFSQVVMKGETMRSGKPADTNYVWLSPWFLSNYYYRYTRPVDFAFYKQLRKPIAKSLYTLLENGWYAADGRPYSKSYKSICDEFLLARYQHLSKIKEQLDPSHIELQKLQLIETWEYRKTTNGLDYIITYYPGQKFFYDQKQKDTRRDLALQIETGKPEVPAEPPQLPFVDRSQMIVSDILSTCGDHKNEPSYRKIAATYSEPLIRMALSETRQVHLEGRILKNKGAYFTDTLKRLYQMHEQRGVV